jgi:hypothetical protein
VALLLLHEAAELFLAGSGNSLHTLLMAQKGNEMKKNIKTVLLYNILV